MKSLTAFSMLLVSQLGAADSINYTTSTGAIFTQVQTIQFGKAWQDPSGTIWSAEHAVWSSTLDAAGTGIFYLFYGRGAINCWMESCRQLTHGVRCISR